MAWLSEVAAHPPRRPSRAGERLADTAAVPFEATGDVLHYVFTGVDLIPTGLGGGPHSFCGQYGYYHQVDEPVYVRARVDGWRPSWLPRELPSVPADDLRQALEQPEEQQQDAT